MRLMCHPEAQPKDLKWKISEILRLWLRMTIVISLAGCASLPGKTPQKGVVKKPATTTTTPQAPVVPRETKVPESTNYAMMQSPKRQVSTQLVAQGKEFIDKKDYDHARQRLEEAVSVDPTNGAAYYHLAVVYYDLRDYPKAIGFLDQAETLLHNSPEWIQTIQQFREILKR